MANLGKTIGRVLTKVWHSEPVEVARAFIGPIIEGKSYDDVAKHCKRELPNAEAEKYYSLGVGDSWHSLWDWITGH